MTTIDTFRLTFHVSHPSLPASEIESVFGLPIRYSQSEGMKKKTKTGKYLGGEYRKTNVSFSLHEQPLNFDDTNIVNFIQNQLDSYDLNYINRINESGGSCHFLIGIFSSNNIMFEFGVDIIHKLSSSGVGVKFDFYGGSD